MGDPVTMAVVSTAVSTIQQQAQVRAQQQAQQVAANRQIEQRNLEQQQREKEQRAQAKQQQASARAAFGARGVSSTGGSANALLDGISARTEDAIADDRQLLNFGIDTMRQNLQQQRRDSLLQQRNNIFNTVVGTAGKHAPSFFDS